MSERRAKLCIGECVLAFAGGRRALTPAAYHLLLLFDDCTLIQDACSLRILGLAGIHSLWRRVHGDIIFGAYRILAQQSDKLRTHEFRSWKVGRLAYFLPPRMVELASDSWNDLR